jgi:RecA-family ATPase
MRSLLQVVRGTSEAGKDLPEILPNLTAATIQFRHGQLHLICGQPGRGKTLLALWYAIKCGEPVLYFSADSDMGTVANRASAVMLKKTVNEVKEMRQGAGVTLIEDELFELNRRVRIDPDPHPSIDGIYEEVQAYIELFGKCPSAIFIDNLMNVASMADSEWTGMRDAMSAFHSLARETEAAVVVLHHTSEETSKATRPGPMKSIMGKVSQLPETILTVALDGDQYHVAAVKNRDGVADPNAENPITVYVDAASMSLFNSHQELDMHRTRRQWQ